MNELILYSLKSIIRNKRRSTTLMIGMIISIAVISGVLFYVDSTSSSLLQNAINNVNIDLSASLNTANQTQMVAYQSFINTQLSPLVSFSELAIGNYPFAARTGGTVVSKYNNFTLQLIRRANQNYTSTYILGVNPSYFKNIPLFQTNLNITSIFNQNEVLVTSDLMTSLGIQNTGVKLNVTNFSPVSIGGRAQGITLPKLLYTNSLTVGGVVTLDLDFFHQLIASFYPSLSSSSNQLESQFANLPNLVIMDYSQYYNMIANDSSLLNFNSVQVKLNHNGLSSDQTTLSSQLGALTNKLYVFYPATTLVDFIGNAINNVENQLNQIKLSLIYFAIPGLMLGIFITRYSLNLSFEEREREIGILRTKAVKRSKIISLVILENSLISILGIILGILLGYLLSTIISNVLKTSINTGLNPITSSSLTLSLILGIAVAVLTIYLSTKQILSSSVISSVKQVQNKKAAFWKRYYLDYGILGIIFFIYVLNYFNFNPIPNFAASIYDFLVPLLTWFGFTLLMTRLLGRIILKLSSIIFKINKFIFGDLSAIIVKNLIYRHKQLSEVALIMILTVSFGLSIVMINQTYQVGVLNDIQYQVGSSVRIQFPGQNYLTYNTSDLMNQIYSNFSNEIQSMTSVYTSRIRLGLDSIILIGIDPSTFFKTAYLNNYFFQSGSMTSAQNALETNNTNYGYNSILISNSLANPTQQTSFRGFRRRILSQQQVNNYNIGDQVPVGSGNQTTTITIGDILNYFPAISDLTGSTSNDLNYIVANKQFLEQPFLNNENVSLLQSDNATFALFKLNNNINPTVFQSQINSLYAQLYPNSFDLSITTTNDKLSNQQYAMNSLNGLTSMEFILVLIISYLTLQIFLTSSLIQRKKEFGTYFAIGVSKSNVKKILTGEIGIISIFSIIAGLILSVIVSTMYLGFLSNLLILEVFNLQYPIWLMIALLGVVVISTTISILYASSKISKLDPANALRTV